MNSSITIAERPRIEARTRRPRPARAKRPREARLSSGMLRDHLRWGPLPRTPGAKGQHGAWRGATLPGGAPCQVLSSIPSGNLPPSREEPTLALVTPFVPVFLDYRGHSHLQPRASSTMTVDLASSPRIRQSLPVTNGLSARPARGRSQRPLPPTRAEFQEPAWE